MDRASEETVLSENRGATVVGGVSSSVLMVCFLDTKLDGYCKEHSLWKDFSSSCFFFAFHKYVMHCSTSFLTSENQMNSSWTLECHEISVKSFKNHEKSWKSH